MTVRHRTELESAGMRRRSIERALRTGDLIRIRPGWYAEAGTDPDIVMAVRCGGTLSCAAALRRHGVWVVESPLHVRVDPDHAVLRRAARVHRLRGEASRGLDTVVTALQVAVECLPFEQAVCAIDSALNRGLTTATALVPALGSPRGRRALAACDSRSESGIETLARLRLRSRRVRVRLQVNIPDVGRVDLLVGDRLVIELDGEAWHSTVEQREVDRRRDSALVSAGYLVLRAGYDRVMNDWPRFEAEVLAVIRRREHRWRAIHRGGARRR